MVWTADTSAMVAAIGGTFSAVVACGTLVLYWRELKVKSKPPDPIVECEGDWMKNSAEFAWFRITVRNRVACRLEICTISAKQPAGMFIAKDAGDGLENITSTRVDIGRIVRPYGTDFWQMDRWHFTDTEQVAVQCRLPAGFPEGEIVLEVSLEEMDGARRRIIKRTHTRLDKAPAQLTNAASPAS